MPYDAIIVGARVAGSATGMLLARKGCKVLLVDKASFPSDTISTHYLHIAGVARLKHWGLLERLIATGCPAITLWSHARSMRRCTIRAGFSGAATTPTGAV